MKTLTLTIIAAATLSACATTQPVNQTAEVETLDTKPVALQTEPRNFDCEQLYSNYKVALASAEPVKTSPKKKSFLGTFVGSGVGTLAAGLMGVNTDVLNVMNTVENAALLKNKAQESSQAYKALKSMRNLSDIKKTAYSAASQEGCSLDALKAVEASVATD